MKRLIVLLLLLTGMGHAAGCGVSHENAPVQASDTRQPEPAPPRQSDPSLIAARLGPFSLEVLPENASVCPGPDGKNVLMLGRDAFIQLVLRFDSKPEFDVAPRDFLARLGRLTFRFDKKGNEATFLTPRIKLGALAPNTRIRPRPFSLYYHASSSRRVHLGYREMAGVDTVPPDPPSNLRLESRHDVFFLLWDASKEREVCYTVLLHDGGEWRILDSGSSRCRINLGDRNHGYFRVKAHDCAGNSSESLKEFVAPVDPPRPSHLRASNKTLGSFQLTWDFEGHGGPDAGDLYHAERNAGAGWVRVSANVPAPPARVDMRPQGRFRVVGKNWIGERVVSDVLNLDLPEAAIQMVGDPKTDARVKRILEDRFSRTQFPLLLVHSNGIYHIEIESRLEPASHYGDLTRYRGECTLRFLQGGSGDPILTENGPPNVSLIGYDKASAMEMGFDENVIAPAVKGLIQQLRALPEFR